MSASLIAHIGADTQGFESGLNRADQMAEKFGHRLTHHLARAFGAGFMIHLAERAFEQAFARGEEIQKAATETGRTTDEVQLLEKAAAEAGITFKEMWEKARSGAVNLDTLLDEMRSKSQLSIIPEQDVKALAEARKTGKGAWAGLKDRGALMIGTAAGGIGDMAGGNIGGAFAHMVRLASQAAGVDVPANPIYNWATKATAPGGKFSKEPARGTFPGMFLLDPRLALIEGLRQQNEGLESKERGMRGQHKSLWTPQLTDWQQIGAETTAKPIMITEIDQAVNALEDLRTEMRRNTEAIKALGGGAQ